LIIIKVVTIAIRAPGATCNVNVLVQEKGVSFVALNSSFLLKSVSKNLKSTMPDCLIWELEMIRMLGGSPMPVAVPPMLEKI